MNKRPIRHLPNHIFQDLGWDFFVSPEAGNYLSDQLVIVTEAEAEAYYEAGNHLYERYLEAVAYAVEHDLFEELAIPPNLIPMIRRTWEDDRHHHLMGRFDLAGGLDGLPIKLIEFNADTPTSLPETSIIQWAQLKANGFDESAQFNTLYEALAESFRRLRSWNDDFEPKLLFSTLPNALEDDNNVSVLMEAAREAGFEVCFRTVDQVTFSAQEGIVVEDGKGGWTHYPFWFKLIPWEYIAFDEPELAHLLTDIVDRGMAVIINPAYTLLFQSKGILKILSDLFPEDPMLLKTTFRRPTNPGKGFVEKVMFGREGSNVRIIGPDGDALTERDGVYGHYPVVYQARASFPQDEEGYHYQAGVFFVAETVGLGFRRSKELIMDDRSQFVGHIIEETN